MYSAATPEMQVVQSGAIAGGQESSVRDNYAEAVKRPLLPEDDFPPLEQQSQRSKGEKPMQEKTTETKEKDQRRSREEGLKHKGDEQTGGSSHSSRLRRSSRSDSSGGTWRTAAVQKETPGEAEEGEPGQL